MNRRGIAVAALFAFALVANRSVLADDAHADDRSVAVIVVVGAPGSTDYGEQFAAWAARWKEAAQRGRAQFIGIGPLDANEKTQTVSTPDGNANGEPSDRDKLRRAIEQIAKEDDAANRQTWLVLIGHGTFDGKRAKFNLRGPDVTAEDLAEWLQSVETPLAVVNCGSSSGPFINRLSGAGRIVVTATKSGYQYNFARFGDYISAAIGEAAADLDKDQQTSLLEAYLAASARTAEFYDQASRLATEHALLDDNGDALGTPADFFRGSRAVRAAKTGAAPDGQLAARFVLVRGEQESAMPAELAARRDAIEERIENLRSRKTTLQEQEYYSQLEALLLELAACYEEAETEAK